MNSYDDTAAFIHVVQHGGFTAAAQVTGIPKARLSQKVRTLEQRLGTPLLKRSTRRLGLTEAGSAYFDECVPLLSGLIEAEARIMSLAEQPHGRVIITAPVWFATYILAPIIVKFRKRNPGFRSEMVVTHSPIDLITQNVDIAFRLWIGNLPDSQLISRHLATLSQQIYAASGLFADREEITNPAQLGPIDIQGSPIR